MMRAALLLGLLGYTATALVVSSHAARALPRPRCAVPCGCDSPAPRPAAGAGSPRPELPPAEVPALLMRALELNDFPEFDAGLKSMWEFGARARIGTGTG